MKLLQNICSREFIMTSLFFIALCFFLVSFREWYLTSVVPEVAWNRGKDGKIEVLAVGGQADKSGQPVAAPAVITDTDSGADAEDAEGYIYYDVTLSRGLQEYTQDICNVFNNVPFELALAVMYTESRFKTDAVNGQCVGLFQINLDYDAAYYSALGIEDINEPRDNILSGVWYLSKLMGKHDDLNLALMHYNIGNKADEYWAQGVKETEYTRKVIAAELNFKRLESEGVKDGTG